MTGSDELPAISIVIPTFRAREHVLRLLGSIRRSPPRRPHEIVVVENASGDGTADAVRERHPDVRLIDPGYNSGCTGGRNLGTRAARGTYLLFLDSDLDPDPGAADALADFLDANPDTGVVGLPLRSPDGTPQSSANRFPDLRSTVGTLWGLDRLPGIGGCFAWRLPSLLSSLAPREVDWVSGGASMVRRTAADAAGPRDERFFHYAEEMDYYFRIRSKGWRIFQIPRPGAVHYDSVSTRQDPSFFRRSAYESLIWFHTKHGGSVPGLLIRIAVALRLTLGAAVQFLRVLGPGSGAEGPDWRQILRLLSVVVWRPAPGPARGPAGGSS